jgi:hypothetical protein
MRSTHKRSGKVAAGTSGDSPKKQGKQPPTSSRGKRKATTTTSQPASTDVDTAAAAAVAVAVAMDISTENAITAVAAISVGGVDVNVAKNNANNGDAISSTTSKPASTDVDATAAAVAIAVAMDISTKNAITAVAAVSVGGVDDNDAKNNANNGDVISSPQRCGKKLKQGTLSKPATPTNQSSPSPKKYKQPRPIVCFWKHCPFPTIGQMTVLCSKEGCSKTMHEQCLYEFEHTINYNHFTGKVEDTHYCPEHHPKKHLIDSEDGSDTDACNEDVGEREMQAAFKSMHPWVPQLPPLPLLPPPAVTNKWDWWNWLTGCICLELPALQCKKDNCDCHVHQICQNSWHESVNHEAESIARYCRKHDDHYNSLFPYSTQLMKLGATANLDDDCDYDQLYTDDGEDKAKEKVEEKTKKKKKEKKKMSAKNKHNVPIQNKKGDIFYSSELSASSLCEDPPDSVVGVATKAATTNDIEHEYNDDADGSVAAATAPAADDVDDVNDDDDDNSEDVDDADSGDEGSEAEIHDACVECDEMENTIDNHYGVDFVKGLPGSPEGWIPQVHLRSGRTWHLQDHHSKMKSITLANGISFLLHQSSMQVPRNTKDILLQQVQKSFQQSILLVIEKLPVGNSIIRVGWRMIFQRQHMFVMMPAMVT